MAYIISSENAMYPVAAEWLRDVESRRAGHIRRIVGTSQVTRLRHLSVRDDDEFIRALCGVRTRGIGSELLAESSMLIARPFRICPKCKGIAKGGE